AGSSVWMVALMRKAISRLRRDILRPIQLWARSVMLLCPLQDVVVRRRLVFVIVRLTIILPHRVIFELIPHQDTPQIGMTVEPNAVKIENLALLKFRAAPARS